MTRGDGSFVNRKYVVDKRTVSLVMAERNAVSPDVIGHITTPTMATIGD